MKQMPKTALLIIALAGVLNLGAMVSTAAHSTTPYFSIRSQGTNAAREMVGLQPYINLCDAQTCYGVVALTGEYSQTFDAQKIAQSLFGKQTTVDALRARAYGQPVNASCNSCDSCDDYCVMVSGSCVDAEKRTDRDWVADYFGLPTDYQSSICFAPRINNLVVDLQGYVGFNADCANNFYARVNLPLTWTRRNLNSDEQIINAGDSDTQKGYLDASYVARVDLLNRATEFFNGKAPALATTYFEPLACSKWGSRCDPCFENSKVRLADVEAVLGWNFACDAESHVGLNIRATAPTGNRPTAEFLFEPIVGNGKHWELGGGFSGHALVWQCDHSDANLNLYVDANITHLFKACQKRCFDLVDTPNSRYWLALRLGPNSEGLNGLVAVDTLEPSDFQFANILAPVANLTCANVQVRANVQADLALQLTYTKGNGWAADFGYNFWVRSCDKMQLCSPTRLETENWALKGSSYVYGFETYTVANADQGRPVALAPSVSVPIISCGDAGNATSNLDNPKPAVVVRDGEEITVISASCLADVQCLAAPSPAGDVNTSIQPTVLSVNDIEFIGTKGMSQKIFVHIDYNWLNCNKVTPFVGIGAAGEFAKTSGCNQRCDASVNAACATTCNNTNISNVCAYCGISQWSVWIKGGAAFN